MALPMHTRFLKFRKCYRLFCRYFRDSKPLMLENVRVRFAPSPTGQLHLGSLRTALYNYLFAKSNEGTFILRIEDTDQTRLVPGAAEKLSEVLDWVGVTPDEGPFQGGRYGPYFQSERKDLYLKYIDVLLQNKTAYRCFCTQTRLDLMRKDALRRGEVPKYDGRCRHLSEEEINSKLEKKHPFVVRFKLEEIDEAVDDMVMGPTKHNVADTEGDPILIKSDSYPTYHFANVVDDHLMKITHVLRGVEWHISTPKHILLFKAFGWEPPKYAHIPVIVGKDGKKLSKRQGDVHVQYYRDKFYEPDALLNYLTIVGGGFSFDEEVKLRSLPELVKGFSVDLLSKNPARLQTEKLEILNRLSLKNLLKTDKKYELIQNVQKIVEQFLKDRQSDASIPQRDISVNQNAVVGVQEKSEVINSDCLSDDYVFKILKWCIDEDRISRIEQIIDKNFQYIWRTPQDLSVEFMNSLKLDIPTVLRCCIDHIESIDILDKPELNTFLHNFSREKQLNFANSMGLLRYVISGSKNGPAVAEMIISIGKNNTLIRLRHGLHLYNNWIK